MARLRERFDAENGVINDADGDVMLRRRMDAVERMANLNVEHPPDPRALSKILDDAHKPCGIYDAQSS